MDTEIINSLDRIEARIRDMNNVESSIARLEISTAIIAMLYMMVASL